MKKNIKKAVAGLGLATVTLAFGEIKAQEVHSLNEVVIATAKNEQKQSQTGKVVTILDSVQLSRSSGRSVAELLNQQAGLQVLSTGVNLGKDKSIFFRGAAAAHAVVLIDGILASDPSSIGSPFDLRLLSVDQVERIEILRGGQSTLYGSDAVAGVINIITKKKADKGNHVYGAATAGSYQTYKGNIGINSKVDAFSYNLSYTHLKTNGISEAALPQGSNLLFDKDGSQQDALNANFSVQLAQRLKVNPFLRYTHMSFDYDNDAFADAANTGETKNFNGGLNAVYLLNKGKITFNYSYQTTNKVYRDAYPRKLKGDMGLIDVFYNQHLGSKMNLLVGLDHRKTVITYYDVTGITKPDIGLFSTYASLFLHDISVFNLELGGRYNKHNNYGYKENFTYNVTPSLLLSKQVKIFGSASSSFKAPALDMLFGAWGANANLKPETSAQLEAGFDLNFFNEQFKIRAVGFKRNIKDAIVYTTGYINHDKQEDKGIEIEPSFTINRFNLGAFYTYTEGKTTSNGVVSDVLLRRPKHMYGVNAGLQLSKNWFVNLQFKNTGKRTDTFYDTTTWTAVQKDLEAYKMLDFYTEYAILNKKIKLFLDLKNITNEEYTEIVGFNTMGRNLNAGFSFSF